MGNPCDPKNMDALFVAKAQLDGVDPFREAERLKALRAEQKAFYELAMADLMGINPKQRKGPSVYDVLRGQAVKTAAQDAPEKIAQLADGQLYDAPSQVLPKGFYNSVDKKLSAFQASIKGKSGNDVQAEYNKQVVSPVRKLLKQLDTSIKESKNNRQLLAQKLKGYGLTPETVYEAREWLTWLGEGGHMKTDKRNVIGFAAERLSRGMANYNLMWSFGNVADMIRVFSHYAAKPGGMKAIAETLADNVKNNPFKRRADLEKKNVYSYQGGTERVDFGNRDPFAWSLTMQKNIAYDLDKKMGGNGSDAIENLVFDTKPWNVPRLYRVSDPSGLFGLVRYPINESRWLIKEHLKVKDAIVAKDPQKVADAAVPLLTYYGARAAILGAGANLPSFIFAALPDENPQAPLASKAFWRDISKVSIAGGLANAALQAAGIEAEADLMNYFQPFGGKLAVRYGLVSDTLTNVGKSGTKAVISAAKGDVPSATLNTAVAAASLNNVLGLGQTMKAMKFTSADKVAKIGDALNSTTLTKVLDTTAKALDEEYTDGKYIRELLKDVAGASRIRKPESEGNARPSRPQRPKRPSRAG